MIHLFIMTVHLMSKHLFVTVTMGDPNILLWLSYYCSCHTIVVVILL